MLEMVQSIMSDMDSDSLTSITDTDEGPQVASVIRDIFWQMVSNKIIPEHKSLVQLTDSGISAKVFMLIPENVASIDWIKYNKIESGGTQNAYADMMYLEPEDFINRLILRGSDDSAVVSAIDPNSSISLDMIINNAGPTFWTSFDDEYICFDSYDVGMDASGLVGSKTLCWATIIPTFDTDDMVDDDFIPDIDDHFFPLLLAEAKSTCFVNMKQSPNPKIEKQARDQKVFSQNDKHRTKDAQKAGFAPTGPDYGRRGRR